MSTSMISKMQNIMGSFVQNIYTGSIAWCSCLFADDRDVILNLPDQDLSVKGHENIVGFFREMQHKRVNGQIEKEIFILNTPAFKADETTGTGSWDAFVYRYTPREGKVNVEPAFSRFDCDFAITDAGEPKITRMDWYQLINWQCWTLKSDVLKAVSAEPSLPGIYMINNGDFVLIQRTLSRLLHSHFAERDMLAGDALRWVQELCDDPHVFHALYAVAPVITCDSVETAWGRWLGMGLDVHTVADSGVQTMTRTTGLLNVKFTKNNDTWYILNLEYDVQETFSPVKLIEPFNAQSWREPAPKMSNLHSPEDVFAVQSIMGQWTSRLKTGRLCEFPEIYMTEKQEETFLWLGEDPARKLYGLENVMTSLKYMDDNFKESKYRIPIIHTGMTPLIEFSEDGNYAYGQWLDQCYTDLSQITKNYTVPMAAMMNLCKYQNEFCKENGQWKMKKLTWSAWCSLEEIYTDPKDWFGWITPKYDDVPWPMPLEKRSK